MIKAVVKHSYLKGSKGPGKARAHINYIQYREGEDRGKGPREFFNGERENVLGLEVKERLAEQERTGVTMHKLILSPGVPGADVQDYTREMVERLEKEHGQRLDWYAVEHQNTEHPHEHVVIMGKDLDGGRVRLDLDDMKQLREWGDRYLEREHPLDRYLDREMDRLMRDGERGKEIEYQRSRGDKMYERLMYGDPDEERKRTGKDAERDRREWEQLDKDLHKVFNRERGLEHKLTYKQYQREAAGRLGDFHSDHTGREFRERWENLAEQDPELAKAAEKELDWLDRMEAEDRQGRPTNVDIDKLIDGLEPWERDDRQFWERIDKEMEKDQKERENERGQPDRSDLADRGWRVEDLFKPREEHEEKQLEKEPERGEEGAPDRSWETFESDRQVRSEEDRQEDREEKERDRGDDFGR